MHLTKAKNILQKQEGCQIALLLGNGINYASKCLDHKWASGIYNKNVGWQELLECAHEKLQLTQDNPIRRLVQLNRELQDKGETAASYPEMFELVRTRYRAEEEASKPQPHRTTFEKTILSLIHPSKPSRLHKKIVDWAQNRKVPILTTNYDGCLEAALGNAKKLLRRLPKRLWRSSSQYPWRTCYAPDHEGDGFAIWHIHGDQNYKLSVRATIDQYMGMAERLRPNLSSKLVPVAERKVREHFEARPPWLGIFFDRKLWIQGLALETHEVILRWLLLRRFHYWTKCRPKRAAASGWYVHSKCAGAMSEKSKIFLECVGIETIELESNRQAYLDLFAET